MGALPLAVSAQSASGDSGGGVEQVVVTATRTAQVAQKAPVTVTALSAEKLEQQGIDSVTDLSGQVPNLTVDHNGMIFLRGIGSTDTREEGDPTVAAYMDGIYLAPYWSERALGFFDVERVEILEGPQGTLFGRNSSAGAINTITKTPELGSFGGDVGVTFGNYDTLTNTGMLNIPIGSTLALRVAFESDSHDYYDPSRETSKAGFDNADTKAGRLSLKWQPNSDLTVLIRGDYEKDNSLQGNFGTAYTNNGHPTSFASDTYFQPSNDSHYGGVSGEIDWNVGPGTLTALASDRFSTFHYITAYEILDQTPFKQNIDGDVQQEELRYAGSFGPVKYVAGLFHFQEDLDPVDVSFPDVFTFSTAANAGINSYEFVERERSNAAYGQLTYSLTDDFRVTGGLRYSDDNKFRQGQGGQIFFPTGTYLVNPTAFPSNPTVYTGNFTANYVGGIPNYADITWHKTDWKAGAEYDVGPNSLLYANASTGFKDGGYNDAITPNQNVTYAPEKILEYEVGSKNQFFDHKLQVNGDIYYYDYTQLQVSGIQYIPNAAPQAITFNSGKATSFGGDLNIIAQPTDADRADVSVGLLAAKYNTFNLPLGDAFHTGPVSYSGNGLQGAAPYTVTVGYSHKIDLGDLGLLTPRVQVRYTGHESMNYTDFPIAQQTAYTKTDLTLSYFPATGAWWAQAYLRNAENNVVYSYVQPTSATSAAYSLMDPRTFGLSVHASF